MDEQEAQKLENDYPGQYHFVQGNLSEDRNSRILKTLFTHYQPDCFVHLAAIAQEPLSRKNPALSKKLNQDMALDVMKVACHYWDSLEGQKRENFRAYFQSTDKVYDYTKINGSAIETSPYVEKGGPASPYAKHKATVEEALTHPSGFFKKKNFPFLIGNLVNVIGPDDLKNQERLIQGAVHTWMRGLGPYKRLIADNKDHQRQYIPVSDACNAITTILEKGQPQNKYNISNGVTLSNQEAIGLVQEAFQELTKEGKIPPVKTEYIATDDKSFRPGADEEDREEGLIADKLYALGYRPQHPGVEGIKLAIREMIVAEWEAFKQERAVSVQPPGNLSPSTLIVRASAEQISTTVAKSHR